MRVYVGNLSFQASEEDLKELFGSFGEVTKADIVMDKMSGRSRGFGFVDMADETAARTAIEALNGKDHQGRPLTVNEAKPQGGGGGGARGPRY